MGTTGDYPPLTFFDAATGRYTGQDIDLVEAFAADRGMTVTFVATTWATMMDDLRRRQVQDGGGRHLGDAGAGEDALLSDPIAITGKVALVRCAEAAKYGSLAAIDRPGVRVVENPGGTNESFAESRMNHAAVTLVADNADAFTALETGAADVMFTDSVEAVWHQSQHEGLIAVHPDQPYTQGREGLPLREGRDGSARCVQPVAEGAVRGGRDAAGRRPEWSRGRRGEPATTSRCC